MPSLLNILAPPLAWLYLHLVGLTSKVYWLNSESREKLERGPGSFIYAFWHGRQAFFPWAYRNTSFTTLVSQSKDGEYIANIIHIFGMRTIRGSSSRGGPRALIELKRALEAGQIIGITPDGPRGPQRKVAEGILYLARKTGKAILPITYSAKRKIVFRGWDDFWIPLPFNRILIQYGNPITVSPADTMEQKTSELAGELNRATDEADAFCSKKEIDPSILPKLRTKMPRFLSYSDNPAQSSSRERLFYFIYNAGMIVLSPLIFILIFFRYPKTFMRHFFDGLSARFGKIPFSIEDKANKPLWIHASSLGECRAALPLARAIKEKYPGLPVVFSSTTPNGIAELKRLKISEYVFYAPLDIPFVLKKVLKAVQPQLIVLLESEIWPNWLKSAQERGIKVGIINGRISQKSAERYLKFGWLSRILMKKISFVSAREKADAERFKKMGVPEKKIRITGNLKFDLLPWNLNENMNAQSGHNPLLPSQPLWVAGSVREGEEEFILDAFSEIRKKVPKLRLLLAPRHIEYLQPVEQKLKSRNMTFVLKTDLSAGNDTWDVLVWNTFGDLWQAYRDATIVYVGGSLVPKGGQNPIEPAWFSKPILFGPSMENFAEPAQLLLESGGAMTVGNSAELSEKIVKLLLNPERIASAGANARKTVERFSGSSTKLTMEMLAGFIHA